MRLIDADALIEFIDLGHYRNPLELCYSEQYVVDMIESRPTAAVIPIEWIKEQKDKCFPYSITERELNDLLIKWERRLNNGDQIYNNASGSGRKPENGSL